MNITSEAPPYIWSSFHFIGVYLRILRIIKTKNKLICNVGYVTKVTIIWVKASGFHCRSCIYKHEQYPPYKNASPPSPAAKN